MNGRFRLLALDIDGTLLRSDKALSPRTRRAVEAARAAGVRLVLVTGRRHPSARKVADDLGGEVPLVLHNGALVMEAGQVVQVRPLPRAAARRAVLAGRAQGLQPVVHRGLRGEGYLVVAEGARGSRLVSYYLDRNGPDVRVDERGRQKAKGGDCSPPDRGRRVAYFFLAFFFGAAFFFAAIAFIPPLKPFGVLCRRWTPSGHEQEKSGG